MKIILSRKGFDASYGGYPSPILPNGRIISLPIPSPENRDKYSKLLIGKNKSYLDLMRELGINTFKINDTCHVDPDVYFNIKHRVNGWRGALGQAAQSNTHLVNQNVQVGDLFLFFGWFRFTENINDQLRFTGEDMHILFGYLQIGKIYRCQEIDNVPSWLRDHPHYIYKEYPNNSIYISRKHLSLGNKFRGYGTFHYNKELKLTKDGYSRTCWDLPEFFRNVNISYHSKRSWKKDYFQSVGRGQEFVVEENERVLEWAYNIIKKCS